MPSDHLAPIVLFTYNRPDHTKRTVEALKKNRAAPASDLIIYSDGPKNESANAQVNLVRDYLRSVNGFRSVQLIERQENFGLAASIISGVTDACRQYGKVIVMEDDLVTSEFFLDYMNDALNHYAGDERIMHVSGYMYPIEPDGLPDTYFLPPASCWGWATWDRAWQHFGKNPESLGSTFSATDRRRFNLDNSFPYWSQVAMNARGQINTWAIFWYATIFQRNGLCLHPRVSYVQNIGHDDSGQHSDASDAFDVTLNSGRVTTWSTDFTFHATALGRLQAFLWQTLPLRSRIKLLASSICERLTRHQPTEASL